MNYIRFAIYMFLAWWFADCAACGRVNPWWGIFAMLVFLKRMFNVIKEVK